MRHLVGFFILISLVTSCKKSPVAPRVAKTELQASALLYNGGREYMDVEQGGITVSIENTTPLINASNKSVVNNGSVFNIGESVKLGSFSLADLPTDLTLVFSKNGYGEYKQFYKNNGTSVYDYQSKQAYSSVADINPSPTLGMKSNVVVNSFSMQVVDSSIYIHCNISTSSAKNNYIRLFMQANNPNLSLGTVPKVENVNMSDVLPVGNGDNTIRMCAKCLKECMHISAGTLLYVIAYGDSPITNRYENPNTGEVVLPNLNRTKYVAPVSFIVP